MMKDRLKMMLKKFAVFDELELEKILDAFNPKFITKNDILLHEGNICKEFYFIGSGCLRTYFIDKKGHEKTRYILLDDQVGTALKSFISQKPSLEFIEAIEDTHCLAIPYREFYRLNNEIYNWKIFYEKILERAYSFQNRKIEALMTQTARQRYEELLKNHPLLIQRLSNKVLASYLDMNALLNGSYCSCLWYC